MFEIYFGNSDQLSGNDRMVTAPDFISMVAVYDALSKSFLNVQVFNNAGEIVREYKNI